jgi:glycosyltransferase involved in cell wall biosynthesis
MGMKGHPLTNGVLVHEWLAEHGGSENVFDTFAEMFPTADLLCLWSDVPNRYPGRILQETSLARSWIRRSKPAAVPASLVTWRKQEGRHDWALISTHLFAHHYREKQVGKALKKYLYVHSPARYIWEPQLDRRGAGGVARLTAPPLRAIDRFRAKEAFALAANSRFVAERIARTWHRHATVIHPPVEVDKIQAVLAAPRLAVEEHQVLENLPGAFILGASRMVPYKALDLVIRTAVALDLPCVIAGSGPDEGRLRALGAAAGVPVTFVPKPSDTLLYSLYQRCAAYVFPAVEDFGLMPVEALAAGAPIVVGPAGGAQEIVADSKAGVIAESSRPEDLAAAVVVAMGLDRSQCRARAQDFSKEAFKLRVHEWMASDR